MRLSCEAGCLWATRDGDARDHVLYAGEAGVFEGRGRIVVQSLEDARFHVRIRRGRAGGDPDPWPPRLMSGARSAFLRVLRRLSRSTFS